MMSKCTDCGVTLYHGQHVLNGTVYMCNNFKVEPTIKIHELKKEIEDRMMEFEDRENCCDSMAYWVLGNLLEWVKQK